MNKGHRIQWHMAFRAAIRLEMAEDKEDLRQEEEYLLNTASLQIDILIYKLSPQCTLHNEIGRLFAKYNIVEYKSPKDELGIDEFFKAYAYAALFKSSGETQDSIKAEDVTITFIRAKKPCKLFRTLQQKGCEVHKQFQGIYYLDWHCGLYFKTQIIVTNELQQKHIWLRSLSDNLSKDAARQLIYSAERFTDGIQKVYADSVLEAVMRSNEEIYRQLRMEDDGNVCQALMELMADEVEAIREKCRVEGLAEGRREGRREGRVEGRADGVSSARMMCYLNMKERNYTEEEALAISELTVEDAVKAIQLRKEGKI